MKNILINNFPAYLIAALIFSACGKSDKNAPSFDPKEQCFELLDANKTGVLFSNIIEENEHFNYLTLNHLYLGGAVGAGDFDKDGRPDLFFVSTTGQPKLYLNKGDFKFEDITEKCGIGSQVTGLKTGIAIADVDANGWPDIYLCRVGQTPEQRGNLLFFNKGGAVFEEAGAKVGLDTKCASTHAAFLDFDRDGDLDCYIINRPANFSTVNNMRIVQNGDKLIRQTAAENEFESDRLMRNDGGHFTDISKKAGIDNRKFSLSLAVQDFNSDGWPDIYVANDYVEPDILYLNNKNGTFTDHFRDWFRHTSHFSMGSDAADLNNDGLPDLISLDMNPEERARQKIMATPMVPDRYNTLLKYGYGHQFMRNMLQINTGGGFSEIGCMAGIPNTDWSWSPLAQDFDNDGWKDIFISNGFKRDVNDLDFVSFTMDSLMKSTRDSVELWKAFANVATVPLRNYFFKNNGDLTFSDLGNQWGLGEKGLSNAAIWADLDGDGDLEIIINNTDKPASIYKNLSREKGLGGHFLQAKLEGPAGNPDGISAKIRTTTADGKQQLWEMQPTRGFMSTVEPIFHVGLGENKTVSKLEIQWLDGRMQILENLPADQRIVLKWAEATGNGQILPKIAAPIFHDVANQLKINFIHKENNFNDFDRERLIPHKLSNQGPALATGDLNNDGLEDFYVGGAFGSRGAMYFQQKDGAFLPSIKGLEFDTLFEDVDALIFDADGDRDNDLLVISGGNEAARGVLFYYDRLYLNDGKGGFAFDKTGRIPREDESGGAVEPFDFDGDGDLDLFIGGRCFPGRYPEPSSSIVLQNNGGKFGNATPLIAPGFEKIGMVTDIKFGDLDGDKKPEMIVCGEWMPVAVFKNMGGKFELATDKFGLQKSGGWWNSLAMADLDGDGDLDLAAGNQGLNSRYIASKDKPLEVFSKDFDGNGSQDPLLCQWEGDQLYPVPYRDQMLKQLPPLKKKFVRYTAYSTAEVTDFFPKKELETALHLTAEELASGWFENQLGKFVFHKFPNEAQVSPVKSLIINDFDGDGDPDIFAVGNDWGFEVESGRCDSGSGLMLMNDGKGHFSPKNSLETGIRAVLDARRAVLLKKVDGREVILVGNNGGPLQAWGR